MFSTLKLFPIPLCKHHSRNVNTVSLLATAFNSKPDSLLKFKLLRNKTGLFGIPELAEPEGFFLIKEAALLEADELLNECCSSNRKRKIVQVFDHLSNSLCKVADLAEFIRLAHPSYRFSSTAEATCIAVGGLVEKLNTHRQLYDCLKDAITNGDKFQTTKVDDHVANLFLFDFEQSGIHLEENSRIQVADLNEKILKVGQQFLHGTTEPRAVPKERLPEGIRHNFAVDGDNIVVGGMFSDSASEMIREVAYKVFQHPEQSQEQRLADLLNYRHEMAVLCGFPSFAHRAMRGSLAESPDLVNDFLKRLSNEIRLEAQSEFDQMNDMKRKICKTSKGVAPWDVAYLTALARHSSLPSAVSDSLSAFFSLGSVMEGLSDLYTDLFNVSLKIEEPEPGELWSNDVYKLAVLRDSTELLGFIYCDFFEHPRKSHQDCHFTIRGGKNLEDGAYQNPVVVVHLNLPNPTWSTPCLLSLSSMENLFHEMGHAMHSMLARTQYQHVTGTRCSTDFAEVPSILMEFFANDARVLHRFAKHYKTGERLPLQILQRILASRYAFSATEMQLQTFYSVLDQCYHGSERWSESVTTTDLLAEVQSNFYGLPYVPNTAWQLRFGHLVGYGAKYYAYLMSRAVASWIWQKYFRENPLNRDAGERLYNEVLQHGGGKPPKTMVADLLERKITPESLASALVADLSCRKEMMLRFDKGQ